MLRSITIFYSLNEICSTPSPSYLTHHQLGWRSSSRQRISTPLPEREQDPNLSHPQQRGIQQHHLQYNFYNAQMNPLPHVTYPTPDPYREVPTGPSPSDPYTAISNVGGHLGPLYNPYLGVPNPLQCLAFTTPGSAHLSLPRRRNHVWFDESTTGSFKEEKSQRGESQSHTEKQVQFSGEKARKIEFSLLKPTRPRSLTFSLDTLGEEKSSKNARLKTPNDEKMGKDDEDGNCSE